MQTKKCFQLTDSCSTLLLIIFKQNTYKYAFYSESLNSIDKINSCKIIIQNDAKVKN